MGAIHRFKTEDMSMRKEFAGLKRKLLASAILLLAAGAPGMALADTTDCTTISTLPYVITTPGHYCMAAPLVFSAATGHAVSVNANNVVVDCNDFAITYTGSADLVGIRGGPRSEVEVRHCRVVNFGRGIEFIGANRRVWIHHNVVDGSTAAGISTTGSEVEVADNTVTNTAGNNGIVATVAAGGSTLVRQNIVRRMQGTGSALNGIRVLGDGRAFLVENIIREVGSPTTATSTAIRVDSNPALSPSPTVIMNGALFQGSGVSNFAVRSLVGSAQSVCEEVGLFGYGPAATPACLAPQPPQENE